MIKDWGLWGKKKKKRKRSKKGKTKKGIGRRRATAQEVGPQRSKKTRRNLTGAEKKIFWET